MRNGIKSVLAVCVVLFLMAVPSRADIMVNSTRTAGTGDYAGLDIVRFFAGFDATTSQEATAGASGLQSVKTSLVNMGPGVFKVGFTSPSGIPPKTTANIYLNPSISGTSDAVSRSATSSTDAATFEAFGTGIFAHDPLLRGFSVQGLGLSSDGTVFVADADPAGGITNPTLANQTKFGSLKGLRVEGFLQNPPGATAFDPAAKVNTFTNAAGTGALFAVAVVPTGAPVHAFGSLAGDKGPTTNFDVMNPVPEPGTVAILGLGGMVALIRRRRAA